MLHALQFTEDFRCWKSGDKVKFHSGVNLIVGDQGTGKSSLLAAIAAACNAKQFHYPIGLESKVAILSSRGVAGGFDFERDNPRVQNTFNDNVQFHIASKLSSHGETNKTILLAIMKQHDSVIFLDEPDMALSIRSITKLVTIFKAAIENGCQIIAAIHHPFLIQAFPDVYSCEHRKWMNSDKFIATQLGDI